MYAQNIVSERLELAAKALGFTPERRSPEECDDFAERLERRYADEYAAARRASQTSKAPIQDAQNSLMRSLMNPEDPRLKRDEVRWIQNERALAMCDAAYFLTRYYFIKTPQKIQRFTFLPGQQVYFDVVAEMEAMRAAIELIICKARQHGVSTETEGLTLQKANFGFGVNCVVASADRTKTGKMAQMTLMGYDLLPWWMRTPYSRRVESDQGMLVFGGSRSGISFQHGSQTSGIARGDTIKIYHLCVSGKTLVRIDDSRLMPIREMTGGEVVIGQDGRPASIKKIWRSPRHNELTSEILVWGTPTTLSCTRDHKILLDERGWVEAKDVRKGDRVIYPVRPIDNTDIPSIGVFKKYDGVWGKRPRSSRLTPEAFPPTFALGRLVGLYLAEGHIQKTTKGVPSCIYFSIHQKEIETVEKWVREVLGEARCTLRRKNSKTAQVCINRRGFSYWLIDNFGELDGKRVSDCCWRFGREFCKGLVYGYLFGDGHYEVRGNLVAASSIRVAIPVGIRELIASLGYGWSQIAYREAGLYYNRNCQQIWTLILAGDTAKALRADFGETVHETVESNGGHHWRWCSGGIAAEVSSNGDGFSEAFYDLEVNSRDHAFLTASGIIHNSECASYTNPAEQIEASLFRCVHSHPDVLGVLESTPEGNTGWFHDTYQQAKDEWASGGSRLCSLFLPWFLGTDKYPTDTWTRTHPIPYDWRPDEATHLMTKRAMKFIRSSPVLANVIGHNWEMPREQAYFWEKHYLEARSKHMEQLWYQEMPTDDDEAFQGSYESVFGREVIAEVDSRRETQYAVFAIIGQSIESRHEPKPDEIDPRLAQGLTKVVPVKYTNRQNVSYHWELIPLLWEESFSSIKKIKADHTSHKGKLFVYREPEPGFDYSIGVKTGSGIGVGAGDTVIAVSKCARHTQEQDEQVAEFRSDKVSHVEAYAWVLAICGYYSKFMKDNVPSKREPYVSIEQMEAPGDLTQLQMGKMGYHRFHKFTRYDGALKDMGKSNKRGWYTVGWSRPILTDTFVVLVQSGWYKVNSPYTIWEMDNWEVHATDAGKQRLVHSTEATDDGVFANAMAAFCPNHLKRLSDRTSKRFMDYGQPSKPVLDITPTSENGLSFPLTPHVPVKSGRLRA